MTMAAGDEDNEVNGNGATGNKVDNDGDGAMGDDNDNDDNGDHDDDDDGNSDGNIAMGNEATGYDNDYGDR
jgi:hypothetical protein